MDAKYKLYDDETLHSGDIYQSFLYAYAWGGRRSGCPSSLLFYPSSTQASHGIRLRIRNSDGWTGAEIQALGLQIPEALAELKTGLPGAANSDLRKALLDGLAAER